MIQPAGGHAVYLDARALLPHDPAAPAIPASPSRTRSTSRRGSAASRSGRSCSAFSPTAPRRRPRWTSSASPSPAASTRSRTSTTWPRSVIGVAAKKEHAPRLPDRLGPEGAPPLHGDRSSRWAETPSPAPLFSLRQNRPGGVRHGREGVVRVQRPYVRGLPREARSREGAGRRRDPGVVGAGPAHHGRLRPVRKGGLRRRRARSLPRPDDDRARRGRTPPDGAGRGDAPAREIAGAGRLRPLPAGVLLEELRRRRLLHGRRARAVRGDDEPEGRRGGQLLRRLQEGADPPGRT